MMRFMRLFYVIYNKVYKEVSPNLFAKKIGVRFGKDCRFINVDFGSEPYLISIGDHVSITLARFVTHDGSVWIFRDKHPDVDIVAPIRIGNNVFIGVGCTILSGITIGDNVIIGAQSLVSRDIPAGVVAAGVPAKPIRSVEEYWDKISKETLHTKHMSSKAKRLYLERTFGLNPNYS